MRPCLLPTVLRLDFALQKVWGPSLKLRLPAWFGSEVEEFLPIGLARRMKLESLASSGEQGPKAWKRDCPLHYYTANEYDAQGGLWGQKGTPLPARPPSSCSGQCARASAENRLGASFPLELRNLGIP